MSERTTAFDYAGDCKAEPPVPGAIAVYWLLEHGWVHKGWLMPPL